jgi:uncharacterized OB-fold protein
MNEPNRCRKCGTPIVETQWMCQECFVDDYLRFAVEGELLGFAPSYPDEFDDGDYDEVEDEDEI